ncbi:hypothetical protein Tco_0450392 [Tanacetum coccineum]
MAPKRATRSTPATTTTPAPTSTTTTTVTNAQTPSLNWFNGVQCRLAHVTQLGMAPIAILRERVSGDLNALLESTDVVKYNQRFQELALLCVRMFPEESDKIERYVGGLPDMIHGNIVASKPKTMQEAIEMATELMDKRVNTIAERQAKNKRKFEKHFPETGYGNDNNITNQKGHRIGFKKHICFKWGRSGDTKKDCPEYGMNNKGNLGTVPRTQLIDSEGIHMDPARLNPSKIGTSPKIKFERGDKQEAAFQLLSKSCCSAPNPLLLPEGSEDFIAYCELQESGRCVDTRWKRVGEVSNTRVQKLFKRPRERENHSKIKQRMQAARDRQKSYADLKQRVGERGFKLELPEELSRVHNTFHISNLKKCHADEPLAVPLDRLHLDDKLHFIEEPLEIVGREVKRLKRSRIPISLS